MYINRKDFLKKLTALLLVSATVLTLFGCGKKNKNEDSKKTYAGAEEAVTEAEIDETPVLWSDTSTVTLSMFTYYFKSYYRTFITKYADYLDIWGLDTSKALSGQIFQEKYDWYQYMVSLAYNDTKETVALADAAKAKNTELGESDLAKIDSAIDQLKDAAENSGVTYEEYLKAMFGEAVNGATVEKCLRQLQLAQVYYDSRKETFVPEESEIDEEYANNPKKYEFYDCIKISVPEEDVSALTACESEEEFVSACRTVITDNNFGGEYDKSADTIEGLIQKKYVYRTPYSETSVIDKWAFEDGRAPYDIYTSEPTERGYITVYMLLPGEGVEGVLYRDDTPLKNLEYCLFEDAAEAEKVYKEWVDGGAAKSDFEALTEKYNGGKSTNIDRGDLASELTKWIFADGVTDGKHTMITVEDTGTYLLYMLADGEPSWRSDVRAGIINDRINEMMDSISEEYPSQYADGLYSVKEVTVSK